MNTGQGPYAEFHRRAMETMRKDFRDAHREHGERERTIEEFPLLLAVMSKEGEERHVAALIELKRLVELIRPMLEKNKMTFGDFLAGKRPFGEAEHPYTQARRALEKTLEVFRGQQVLSEGEIEGILNPPEEEITEEIVVVQPEREVA